VIGRGFLGDRILQEGAFCHALRGQHRRPAAAALRCDRRGGTERRRDDAFDAGVSHRVLKTRQMPARDMAGFMGKHADQLIRRLRPHDQAGIDEFVLSAGDERIDLLVLDQIDVQCVRIEPRRLPNRGHHRADVGLDLGIADKVLGCRGNLAKPDPGRNSDYCQTGKPRGHKRCLR